VSRYHIAHAKIAQGDPYVSDETGEPLVVYHGSATDFDAFEPGHGSGWSVPRKGFYFTDDRRAAEEFGGVVKAFNLRMRNPLDLRGESSLAEYLAVADRVPWLAQALRDEDIESVHGAVGGGYAQSDDFVDAAKDAGYDAVIMPDRLGGPTGLHFDSYIVFEPSQIMPFSA